MGGIVTTELKRIEQASLIEQWRSSGKSAKAWCRENNLVYTTFLGWVYRSQEKKKALSSSFIEIKDRPQTSSGISLEYDGIRINISSDFDPVILNQCLQALRGKKC
jgi:hypothetical protein